jgi:hypothetical protein
VIHAVATREQRELARRERLYRSGRPDVRDAVGGDHPPDQVKPLEFTVQWEAGEAPKNPSLRSMSETGRGRNERDGYAR